MHVIWKATEKEQAKRYQTAIEFKNAINAALLPDPSFSEKFSKWFHTHVVLVICAIVLFIFAVFFILIIIN
jgi:serine/threonine-protein kinase